MKKNILTVLFISSLLITACSGDDEEEKVNKEITLEKTSVTLKSGDNYSIKAEAKQSLSYKSENEYVAKVNEKGEVEARKIGETDIIINSQYKAVKFNVTVKPEYNTYPEPTMDWGTTKSALVSKLGKPTSETATGITYTNYSSKAPIAMYLFDKDNKLKSSAVAVKTTYSSELGGFLSERYVSYAYQDYTLAFVNAYNNQDVSLLVGTSLYEITYWLVMYMPYSLSRSTYEQSFSEEYKELLDLL